ncbi:putative tyrosine carboxypeptidase MATCAP2 isoform X1 [Aquarana catesbeiana]|uniref:putative tyrosine carboxypeptidase MATCAP2 isoform X1 n=2 Tax=Aquarana catesbeiana TaxID=8400 RepID=UPI003CCA01D8
MESICVTETLHWPKKELSRKSVLNVERGVTREKIKDAQVLSMTVLRDTFTTGTSSYNVLLQSQEEKKQVQKDLLLSHNKKRRKGSRVLSISRSKEYHKVCPSSQNNAWLYARRNMSTFISRTRTVAHKCPSSITVSGNSLGFTHRPKPKAKRKQVLTTGKDTRVSKSLAKEDPPGKKFCILNAIKPTNVDKEKIKFFKAAFTYNPQFEYANPALPNVLARHSHASDRFLKQAVNIMKKALKKYGSYEKFEQATGGSLLPKSRIWLQVRKYMEKEGCLGEIVVHLTEDLLSRASMTVVNGRPTLTINISTAREQWLEGMLRHEIGTHYFRGMNNNQQPWNNVNGRKKYGLKPVNPTEEGLASIHSVLFRKDPFLWRAALLYYTVYQASHMSFSELFQDVGQFVKDPNTRWDYCVRAKRGCTDTSQPGCFSKDQVYLDGILRILRHRETIDFHLLTAMGKVSYEDVDRLKDLAVLHSPRIPQFLQDRSRYMEYLEKIMEVNELTDEELKMFIA